MHALKPVNLEIRKGEIFALLGPNGAGKTTLINIICGIVTATSGRIVADGHDIVRDYRAARTKIGLVPQELTTDSFETVWATVSFSRGLFGRAPNPDFIAGLLRDLSLSDKRDSKIMDSVRRHEAPRDDRQGALARARHPVPRRADRRRGRGAAPRHVEPRARPAARAA